jgi:hypothetical protein
MPNWHDALCFLVASSRARPWIVLRAATRLPPPRRRDLYLRCDRGARSKVGGEHPDGSRPTALLARTELVDTTASGMRMSMRLLGDGLHGRAEPIQTFRCQACRTTFSARLHTPLYQLKTPSHRVALMPGALAEGLDVSAAERVFGIGHTTITSWRLASRSACPNLT